MSTINSINLALLEYLKHNELFNADLVEPLVGLVVLSIILSHLKLLHSIVRKEQSLALFLYVIFMGLFIQPFLAVDAELMTLSTYGQGYIAACARPSSDLS